MVVRMTHTNGATAPQPEPGVPIEYPVIQVAGRFFTLKYSLFAQYQLDKRGENVAEIMNALIPRLPDGKADPSPPMKPGRIVAMMSLLSACAAHNFTENHEPIWTPDDWAAKIPDQLWGECCKAVAQAVIKAPQAATPSPAQPAEPSGPTQTGGPVQ